MSKGPLPGNPIARLPARDEKTGSYNVIIETPRGSRNKYKFEEELGIFGLSTVLPAGAVFPYDFGFLPSTVGEDGDPLDVLVLLDDPAFAGCRVPCRLLGVIEAEQTERDGKKRRNDRIVAVASKSRSHEHVLDLDHMGESELEEIEHFFASYNEIRGKKFKPLGRSGPPRAEEIVREGAERFRKARGGG